jgi:hypothetical protein
MIVGQEKIQRRRLLWSLETPPIPDLSDISREEASTLKSLFSLTIMKLLEICNLKCYVKLYDFYIINDM